MASQPQNSVSIFTPSLYRGLSGLCFVLGFASILASIVIWAMAKGDDAAHAERFGIFIGLWAPTFMIIADRLSRANDRE